ncbi:uncharacterized protein LOC125451211 isoform X2 [Stegostoma tigrinum]|nr:uncharacterized protein LOC125451211 isoform X2 [Stegostoma tigrinum]XP_048384033.2 uncharacterized protein LOC125451211 isoform X2 [Stegostoma tigrinum]
MQKQICLNQGGIAISANQNTDKRDILQVNTAGCNKERSDSACLLNNTSSNSNICTVVTSKSVSNKGDANTLPPHSVDTSRVQIETLNTKQTDYINLTACSISGQSSLLNNIQPTNNPEKSFENNPNYTLLNNETPNLNHKEVININPIQICHDTQNGHIPSVVTQPVITFPLKNSVQTSHVIQPITSQLKSNYQLLPSTSQCVWNPQQNLHYKTVELSGKCPPAGMLNAVQPNQCTVQMKTTQVMQNIQNNNLLSVSTLCGKQKDSESQPEDKGSGHRKPLHLIDLISDGLIQPGEDVLEVKLQVTYRKKELSEYSSMAKSSSKLPEIHPISQSTILTNKTSPMPPQCRTSRDSSPKTQKEKSKCNFMQFHEILLIRNEEFLPCHIMDQHWKFYAECDEWNF